MREGAGGATSGSLAVSLPTVPRLWPESTVVCLGGGPSLTPDDVRACRDRARVIAINNAYQLAPWADVLYACDEPWWRVHGGVPTFSGPKYSIDPKARRWPGVVVLENTGEDGLEMAPTGLRTGKNSGYQAINLAVHLGARRIVLLGYDMAPADDGRTHWFGDHPAPLIRWSPYPKMAAAFATLVQPLRAIGVQVLNASRRTAVQAFPRVPLEEALACSV